MRLDRSCLHLLHRAGQCADEIFSREMKAHDLTPRQFAVLLVVSQGEGLSQADIVDRAGIDRSTLSEIVRRLQRRGFLQRRRSSDDARAYTLKLTSEGRHLLRIAEPVAKRINQRVLDALPGNNLDAFIAALLTVVNGFTARDEPSVSGADSANTRLPAG